MTDISPPDKTGGAHYKAQYEVSPSFRKFWEKMFPGTQLSNKELHELTDSFIRNVADNMNQVLNWALREQKKRHREEKEQNE